MKYSDLTFWEFKERQERNLNERIRIKKRNKAWYALNKLRESGAISIDEFKRKKNEIFAFEIEQITLKKALLCKLKEYQKLSVRNRNELSQYVKCVCFGCLDEHYTCHITYDDDTAVCPSCKRKTVIPYLEDIDMHLYDLYKLYFPNDCIDEIYEE